MLPLSWHMAHVCHGHQCVTGRSKRGRGAGEGILSSSSWVSEGPWGLGAQAVTERSIPLRTCVTSPSGLLLYTMSMSWKCKRGNWRCDSVILPMFLVRYHAANAMCSHQREWLVWTAIQWDLISLRKQTAEGCGGTCLDSHYCMWYKTQTNTRPIIAGWIHGDRKKPQNNPKRPFSPSHLRIVPTGFHRRREKGSIHFTRLIHPFIGVGRRMFPYILFLSSCSPCQHCRNLLEIHILLLLYLLIS